MAIKNILIGELDLTGIQTAPREQFQIEVTFEIDAHSILKVSAVEMSSGFKKEIIITNEGRLTEEDYCLFFDYDINACSEEDNKIKERIEARNSLDNYL
jgi:molecular chaperone DnaK (HSP70)